MTEAAKLRGVSLSDDVRLVTVPRAQREVLAARERTLAMTAEEQLAFWNALAAATTPSDSRKRLGSVMRGVE